MEKSFQNHPQVTVTPRNGTVLFCFKFALSFEIEVQLQDKMKD